jgi:hypothetical protein
MGHHGGLESFLAQTTELQSDPAWPTYPLSLFFFSVLTSFCFIIGAEKLRSPLCWELHRNSLARHLFIPAHSCPAFPPSHSRVVRFNEACLLIRRGWVGVEWYNSSLHSIAQELLHTGVRFDAPPSMGNTTFCRWLWITCMSIRTPAPRAVFNRPCSLALLLPRHSCPDCSPPRSHKNMVLKSQVASG